VYFIADSTKKIKGRLLNFAKAKAIEKAITGTIIKSAKVIGNERYAITDIPAPPAMKINCLNVKLPNILSSTSINCGI
jgi:hypothetical protein